MTYQEIVEKLGVNFKETPRRVEKLSKLIEAGEIEKAKRFASIYSKIDEKIEKDAEKSNIVRVMMPSEYAEKFFEKLNNNEDVDEFVSAFATLNRPSPEYEPDAYEYNKEEKKVAVIYKKSDPAKDRRPPKDWWENCMERAKRFADDPASFCGALYYHPEDFPHGAKLKESFGKPYKKGSVEDEEDKELKEAIKSFFGYTKDEKEEEKKEEKVEKKVSFWDRVAFWRKKKAVDTEAMKTDYRTHTERKHKDYSTEGKGEGDWEDYKVSRYSEASRLLRKINLLRRKISALEKMEEEEKEMETTDKLIELRKRIANLKKVLSETKDDREVVERINRLKEKIASLKEKLGEEKKEVKKKAVFDPRILTDLDPEKAFGPTPEMAAEKGIPKHKYEIEFAHEKSEDVKKPIPKTQQMVAEKPAEVEKAYIEKVTKATRIVDKMVEKGIINADEKYKKIAELLKFNDFELSRVEKFVDEVKEDKTVLVVDEGMIDLSKIIGD